MATTHNKYKKNDNQVERNLFVNSILMLLCLLSLFFVFSNLDFVWERVSKDYNNENETIRAALSEIDTNNVSHQIESEVYLWGNNDNNVIVKRQLDNMKQKYVEVEELSECGNAKILFVCKEAFTRDDINTLREVSSNGTNICILGIPKEESLRKHFVQDFLGIESYSEEEEKAGYRLCSDILFGNMYENTEKFSGLSILLKQRTEVYASALEEEQIKNELLTPLFWRYKENSKQESVYVISDELLQGKVCYAIISFFMTKIYDDYMYPIINAYCFTIQGMPYSSMYESDFLDMKYGKDSLGVENGVFFPLINRCEERYDLVTSWYSKERLTIENTDNTLLKYYMNDIKRNQGIIGTWDDTYLGCYLDIDYKNRLKVWTKNFEWVDGDVIQVPYDEMKGDSFGNTIVNDLCEIRGYGFHCVTINMEEFLSEDSELDWIEYFENLESILGVEGNQLSWIERMTVDKAIYRIKCHDIMEPIYTYEDNRILVDIMNFAEEAYFYLYTSKEVKEAIGADIKEISEGVYFVHATKDRIEIEICD